MPDNLFLYGDRYKRMAEELRDSYVTAEPFPHAVIDNFLPDDVCERLLEEFPSSGSGDWNRFKKHHSQKLATRGELQFGEFTRSFMAHMSSPACLQLLEAVSGIEGLLPDPYLEGGGLHQIERGGYLKVHADFNKHPRVDLDRRMNLIVYFNKNWREEYGGHLELWDRDMTACVKKILPIYNRCVIFNTTSWAYHGHPEKLTCPEGVTRKSAAIYYYTVGRPAEEDTGRHGTLWQEIPKTATKKTAVKFVRTLASAVASPGNALHRFANHLDS